MAESELEIEGVIAHEVAHVERRHLYRIYRNEQKKKNIATGIGVLAAVLTGTTSKENKALNADLAFRLGSLFAGAIANSLYEGYPRSMEEEADALSGLYLQQQYGQEGVDQMVLVLKKLRYYGDYVGVNQKKMQAFRSHPLLDDRIIAFTNSTVRIFDKPITIIGKNPDGATVVTIRLTCQRRTAPEVSNRFTLDPTQILGEIYATADIGEARKFKDVSIELAGGEKLKLDNKEDSLVGPYEDEGFLLRGDIDYNLDECEISKIKVNLLGLNLDWQIIN